LWPKVKTLLKAYPDIQVEISMNYGFVDIVAERFDAGVLLGESLDQDMIAVPISGPLRMAVVASPEYLKDKPLPTEPKALIDHQCINIRLPTYGGLYAWEFEKAGKVINVNVKSRITFSNATSRVDAALEGFGFAYLPEDMVTSELNEGRLIRVLEDWCPPFDGYYLYYPNRSNRSTPALRLLIEALRWEG
jgi:DNA-binding transcriptional LysR family regulator